MMEIDVYKQIWLEVDIHGESCPTLVNRAIPIREEANECSADARISANMLICSCKHSDLLVQSGLTMFMLFRRFTERSLFSLFTIFYENSGLSFHSDRSIRRCKRFMERLTNKWREKTIGNRITWLAKFDYRKCERVYFLKDNLLERW